MCEIERVVTVNVKPNNVVDVSSLAPELNMIMSVFPKCFGQESYHLDPDVTRDSLRLLILQTISSTLVSIHVHLKQKQHVYLKGFIDLNHTSPHLNLAVFIHKDSLGLIYQGFEISVSEILPP